MVIAFEGFRSLVERSPDAISSIDKEGEIPHGSPSTVKILGYRPDEIIGRDCLDLIHPEDRAQVTGALDEVLAAPARSFQRAGRVRHKDGTYCRVESTLSNILCEPKLQAIVISCMATLIEGLLSFASGGLREPLRYVDRRHAFAQATQNLVASIEASGATISVGPLPILKSNETHLVRLVQTLISNPIKYRAGRALTVRVNAEQCGKDWVLRVEDNGIGIAAQDQTRVVAPFVRLVNKAGLGSGLGLAVCQKIVEELGGAIWVESNHGAASTFCFTIAAQEPAMSTATTHGESV